MGALGGGLLGGAAGLAGGALLMHEWDEHKEKEKKEKEKHKYAAAGAGYATGYTSHSSGYSSGGYGHGGGTTVIVAEQQPQYVQENVYGEFRFCG
jgi:hypothetical protein